LPGCALLTVADVDFAYGDTTVLRQVSFHVPRGRVVGILGPNGSGKTTLLRLLSGVATPTRGEVRLEDRPLARLPRSTVARRVAVVPQETHLAFEYTVLEIALMGRYPHLGAFQIEGPGDVAIAERALAATGTLALAHRAFATLSGGEKQRVVIASALAQFEPATTRRPASATRHPDAHPAGEPAQLLLLDEPTASLDVHYQVEVADLLRRLNKTRGLTTVVSTHDLNFAASLCDDLVLLKQGRVVASGPTAEVLTPATVHALYGVEADVRFHDLAGHITVVPIPREAAVGLGS
jgi:iron complex transport system ATP-binding protein